MRSQILYVPDGITLDLDAPGLGHPDGRAILERHYKEGSRYSPEFHRGNPAFACVTHLAGTNPGLYLKKISGEWWAVHYESGDCPSRRIPAPMSDEHKYQTEYWARAAEDAGWTVELEHSLSTGTRPDALIRGPVLTGVEVQRSPMTAAGAVGRTRRAALAGVMDVWFTGSDIQYRAGKAVSPMWAHRVPTAGAQVMPWGVLPPRQSAVATGLRVIQAMRCTLVNFNRCPDTGRSQCGKFHPRPVPWMDLHIDDVAARFPAGEMVPLRFWRTSRREDVFLVSPDSLALYEELTGRRAVLDFHPRTEEQPPDRPTGTIECGNEQTFAEVPMFSLTPAAVPGFRDSGRPRVRRRPRAGLRCGSCDVSAVTAPGDLCQSCKVIARLNRSTP